jgi:signal transduction histidine kinase
MRSSFKFRLFIHVILITAIIIFINRMIAQSLLTRELEKEIHQDMGVALTTCASDFYLRDEFISCFKTIELGDLLNSVSDFYLLCDTKQSYGNTVEPSSCYQLIKDQSFWTHENSVTQGDMLYSHGWIEGKYWYAVKFSEPTKNLEVWLERDKINVMMNRLWGFRDRFTIYVIPSIILMLMLLTLYLIRMMMQPINSIQENISRLNAQNLDSSVLLNVPFKEFAGLVQVFEDLRVRLSEGFLKARRFSSDASHELRTPLAILRGNMEQLIGELPVGSDLQVRIRNVSDEVERLIEITEKLLLLSRADSNSLSKDLTYIDLSQFLTNLLDDSPHFRLGLKISSFIEPGIIWCCDKTLIAQLLNNLFSNAVKFNQRFGWVDCNLIRTATHFQLSIENPIVEIPSDLSVHAFDRFYRGDISHTRKIDGVGLGLSISLEIAKVHDGTLTLVVTERQTVVVTLTVPLRND